MKNLPTLKHKTGKTTYYFGFNVTPQNVNSPLYQKYFGLNHQNNKRTSIILRINEKNFDATIELVNIDNSKKGVSAKRSTTDWPVREFTRITYSTSSEANTLDAIKNLGNNNRNETLEIKHLRNNIFAVTNIDSNYEERDNLINIKKNLKKRKIIYKPKDTERIGSVTQRRGQNFFRNKLHERWEGECSVTKISIPEILIASHIIPWRKSSDKQRLDPGNGILLSKNLDGLFDRYLISFEDNGEIIISKKINSFDKRLLGLNEKMKLRFVKKDMIYYLREHRKVFNDLEKKNI